MALDWELLLKCFESPSFRGESIDVDDEEDGEHVPHVGYGVDQGKAQMGWSLFDHACIGLCRGLLPRRIQTLFRILSKQKIFRYFMHMRAKTISGF